MKSNNNKINLIIITLGVIFVLSIISNYNINDDQMNDDRSMEIRDETNLKNPKKSGSWTLDEIIIDDDGGGAYTWDTAKDQDWCNLINGIYIIENVTFTVLDGSGSGLTIKFSDKYFIINNCTSTNAGSGLYDAGIKLENTNNGTLTNNNCSNNGFNGILLYIDSDNNTISGNTANDNTRYGIYLFSGCDNNTISGNTANDNTRYGIYLYDECDNNTISGNTANDNTRYGIYLYSGCDDNTISGNTANNNDDYGIYLFSGCDDNTISGNTASNVGTTSQNYGIYLFSACDDNTISGNTANNNDDYGIYLTTNCDNNNITDNYIYFNTNGAIRIVSDDCDNTLIKANILVSINEKFIIDGGTSTFFTLNHYLPTSPCFIVEIIAQSFSTIEFIITFNISSNIGLELSDLSIQMWWNGTSVPSNNITELGNGLYNISLTPILVEPGQNPILLNMTISAAHHKDKYFKLNLAVDPKAVAPTPIPPSGGGGGGGDGKKKQEEAIPGYNLFIFISVILILIGTIYIILVKKRFNH